MAFDSVTVEPQPVIRDTMIGDCYVSVIEAGGYRWEQFGAPGTPLVGRLIVTEVSEGESGYAYADFTAHGGDGTSSFMTYWPADGFRPTSDPCGW